MNFNRVPEGPEPPATTRWIGTKCDGHLKTHKTHRGICTENRAFAVKHTHSSPRKPWRFGGDLLQLQGQLGEGSFLQVSFQVILLACRSCRAGNQMKTTIPNTDQRPTPVSLRPGTGKTFLQGWSVEDSGCESLNSLCHTHSGPTVVA